MCKTIYTQTTSTCIKKNRPSTKYLQIYGSPGILYEFQSSHFGTQPHLVHFCRSLHTTWLSTARTQCSYKMCTFRLAVQEKDEASSTVYRSKGRAEQSPTDHWWVRKNWATRLVKETPVEKMNPITRLKEFPWRTLHQLWDPLECNSCGIHMSRRKECCWALASDEGE